MGGEPDAARLTSEAHRVLATFVPDDTLELLCRALAEELRCGTCIMLFTPRGDAAVSTAGHHPDPDLCAVLEEHANFLQRTEGSRLLEAVQRGETTIATAADIAAELPSTTPEFRALADRIRLRAVLGVPVRLGDEITGAILLSRHDDDERPFSDADRERAERAAREMGPVLDHARFRAAFEHAPTGMALLSVGGEGHRTTIVEVNAALCRMAGVPREELVGMDPAVLAHPDDRETDFDQVARLFAGGLPAFSLERRFVRAGGSVLWTQLHVSMIRSGGRLPTHLVVQVQEISHERRLAALVEHTPDAIVSTDADGTVRSWNRGAERLYGRRAAEILGRSIELTVPPERRGGAERLIASVARGEEVVGFETVALTGDGRRRDIVLSLSPVRDAEGRVTGVAGVARDITDRKRSEALTRGILDAALEAIVTVKPDATVVGFNPAAERMFDRSAEDVLGRSATELLVAEQDREEYARMLHVLAEADDPQGRRFQLHGLRADGTTFPGEVSISRVPGDEVHITGHIRDVSDRRRRELEDQLLAALTRRALEGTDPAELMADAASAVCEVLGDVEVEVHERAGAARTFVRGACGEHEQRPRTFDIVAGEA
ncbi:MAG TPA: PAS domain S-box protein, partial [Solirubrobacteraceae bacterium]|nr:PAS domain S-box protein [Solirubrobacteraceae bacterium]